MEEVITWVGIDAHKKTLAVAAFQRPGQEPEEFTIDNDERAIRKLVRRLERDGDGREIRVCYEAGTCGYALQRRPEASGGVVCEVIAPSLVPRKPGERIKTDRRDARRLAELYRACAHDGGAHHPSRRPSAISVGVAKMCAQISGVAGIA
jgi:transposase